MYFFQQIYDQVGNKVRLLKQLEIYVFTCKPKLNQVVQKQLLFGNIDESLAL